MFRIQSHTISASQRTQRAPLLCFYSCFKPAWVLPNKRQRPCWELACLCILPFLILWDSLSTEPRTCSSIHGEDGLPGRKNKGPTNSWIIYIYIWLWNHQDVLWCLMMSCFLAILWRFSRIPQKHPHVPWQHSRQETLKLLSQTQLLSQSQLLSLSFLFCALCLQRVSRLFENDSAPPHTGKSGCHESWHLNLGIILNNLGITWNNWVFWPPPLLCVFSPDAPSLAWASLLAEF